MAVQFIYDHLANHCRLKRVDIPKRVDVFAKVHDYACAARIRFAVKKAVEILKE